MYHNGSPSWDNYNNFNPVTGEGGGPSFRRSTKQVVEERPGGGYDLISGMGPNGEYSRYSDYGWKPSVSMANTPGNGGAPDNSPFDKSARVGTARNPGAGTHGFNVMTGEVSGPSDYRAAVRHVDKNESGFNPMTGETIGPSDYRSSVRHVDRNESGFNPMTGESLTPYFRATVKHVDNINERNSGFNPMTGEVTGQAFRPSVRHVDNINERDSGFNPINGEVTGQAFRPSVKVVDGYAHRDAGSGYNLINGDNAPAYRSSVRTVPHASESPDPVWRPNIQMTPNSYPGLSPEMSLHQQNIAQLRSMRNA